MNENDKEWRYTRKYHWLARSVTIVVRPPIRSKPLPPHPELSIGSDLKTSSWLLRCHWKLSFQVRHMWLFCWHRSFTMSIRTGMYGSVEFPVLLPIDIQNPHHYWNVVCRQHWFRKYLSAECAVHPCRVGDIKWGCTMDIPRCLLLIDILLKYRDRPQISQW